MCDSDIEDGVRPVQEIDVTEEMIEAGVKRFCILNGWDVPYGAVGDLLEEVFREMALSSSHLEKAGN